MYALTLGALAALLALALGAASCSAPSPPPFLPTRLAGWSAADRATFDRSNLFQFIDGGAEVYLAYDFRRVWVSTYRRRGAPDIVAEVYDMGVGEDAYGVLSVDPTGEETAVGSLARYGAGLLRFCQGRWFVRVLAERETPQTRSAVITIGKHIADGIEEEAPPPDMLGLLPSQGLQPNSATFFHTRITLNQLYYLADENLLHLGPDTDAVIADYRLGKGEAKLIMVRYLQAARCLQARDRFRTRYLRTKRAGSPEQALVTKTEGGRFAGVKARGRFLVIVVEAPDARSAAALLDRAAGGLPRERRHGSR